jgi:predicted transcriptional regulator
MTITTETLHIKGRVVRMVRMDDGTRYLTVPEAVKLAAGLYACVDAALC